MSNQERIISSVDDVIPSTLRQTVSPTGPVRRRAASVHPSAAFVFYMAEISTFAYNRSDSIRCQNISINTPSVATRCILEFSTMPHSSQAPSHPVKSSTSVPYAVIFDAQLYFYFSPILTERSQTPSPPKNWSILDDSRWVANKRS